MSHVTAFIPVRGGSKSIPLKNIKQFCGRHLVYWPLQALENTAAVDDIIVATDSDAIERTVAEFAFPKTKVYRRRAENATDTATTESVMLEYIEQARLPGDAVFMLVQATSPLTSAAHFAEALALFRRGGYDALLSCVRNYRFFWNDDGTSKNYDYKNRPRRQDFPGQLMENGALYISTAGAIARSGNRLSGKIGVYEMPEYTATEIDEPADWTVLETLMREYVSRDGPRPLSPIKLFLTDVDGVLTDGGMYYSEQWDALKKFNTRDGMAFELLRSAGVKTGIITSEDTPIVAARARKLKVDFLIQGRREGGKLEAAREICAALGVSLGETAYIGDDINCGELLQAVGLGACPADAASGIARLPRVIHLTRNGGAGCVREFAEMILEKYT